MARGRRSTFLLSVATLALPVTLGACATIGNDTNVALSAPGPSGGASEPLGDAATVDAARLLRIGAATESVGDLENAIAMYQRALSLAPDSIEALVALADAYRRLGVPENAAKAYRGVLEREPSNLAARRGLGNALIALGQPGEALMEFDLLLAAEPLDERGHNGRGVALSLLGRHDEARLAYEAGLKLAPADLQLNNNLATLLLIAGQPEQALPILRRIANYPDAPERVHQNLARATKEIAERGVRVSALAPPEREPTQDEATGIIYQAPDVADDAEREAPHADVSALDAAEAAQAADVEATFAGIESQAAEAIIGSPQASVDTYRPEDMGDPSRDASIEPAAGDEEVPPQGDADEIRGSAASLSLPSKGATFAHMTPASAMDRRSAETATTDEAGLNDVMPSAHGITKQPVSAVSAKVAGYRVQLTAETSSALALQRWEQFSEMAPELLEGLSPHISLAPPSRNGTFYRLRTSPLLSRDDAETLCDALMNRSIRCYLSAILDGAETQATVEQTTPGGQVRLSGPEPLPRL